MEKKYCIMCEFGKNCKSNICWNIKFGKRDYTGIMYASLCSENNKENNCYCYSPFITSKDYKDFLTYKKQIEEYNEKKTNTIVFIAFSLCGFFLGIMCLNVIIAFISAGILMFFIFNMLKEDYKIISYEDDRLTENGEPYKLS